MAVVEGRSADIIRRIKAAQAHNARVYGSMYRGSTNQAFTMDHMSLEECIRPTFGQKRRTTDFPPHP